MFFQVGVFMPIDTTITYQYRYGIRARNALQLLSNQGGIKRFYAGVVPALVMGPLSRFGDTASNAAIISFVESHPTMRDLPVIAQTCIGSVMASGWRVMLMPLDMLKTISQVKGQGIAVKELKRRIHSHGILAMWQGSSAACLTTLCGHLPWYSTFNFLNRHLPKFQNETYLRTIRNGFIGFTASMVTDCCTNSLRVLKAIRQAEDISYRKAAKLVIEKDGMIGLFSRGLKTRMFANGFQGLIFTAVWKTFEEKFELLYIDHYLTK